MLKKSSKDHRLVFCLMLCTIIIALSVSQATGKSVTDAKKNNLINTSILRFFVHDWNWWTNKPDMYMIPFGNVGIGTTNPSMKLDVSGSINATPILGKWEQNQSRGGPGNYTWDVQLLNTDPTCLNWTTGQDHIIILKSGYYQLNVNVYQCIMYNGTGFIELKRNADVVSRSRINDINTYLSGGLLNHHFSDVGYFDANDKVFVYSFCTSGQYTWRIGGYYLSTMSIIRLN